MDAKVTEDFKRGAPTTGRNPLVRAFLALDLPQTVRSFVIQIERELRCIVREAKWVDPHGMHLTIKFLGNVPHEAIPDIVMALERPLSIPGPIHLALSGLGCFPNMKRPRVIWLGVRDEKEVLRNLVEEIEESLVPLGFSPEKRRFKPHLTLARFKEGRDLPKNQALLRDREDLRGPDFSVDNAVLFESVLRPEGAQYYPLRRFYFPAT